MRSKLFIFLIVFLCRNSVAAEPKLLGRSSLESGEISLFDGETLYGWQPIGEAKWEVVDGEIRSNGEKPGFLMTTTAWADYELHFEFKAPAQTNSGVFLRTPLKPTDPAKDCWEVNIAPQSNPFPTLSLVKLKKSPTETTHSPRFDSFPLTLWDGKWHKVDVRVGDSGINVDCDGGHVYEYEGKPPNAIGYIGLQSNSGPVAFRNVRLEPEHLKPLFNEKDLTGWSTQRAENCTFEVTKEGELHLTNGPGQIDTQADFKNFVLQAECKVNGDGLNSGIFFRTLRTGRWVGYESQINNKFKDGDRTKPADFGTGAIYRRQAARRIVPNDHEWFTNTIVADGAHIAVWVNGYQVSDWTDDRPEKESARDGKRLGGGAIAIQGHDATTDFLFRNIRAVELPRE